MSLVVSDWLKDLCLDDLNYGKVSSIILSEELYLEHGPRSLTHIVSYHLFCDVGKVKRQKLFRIQ